MRNRRRRDSPPYRASFRVFSVIRGPYSQGLGSRLWDPGTELLGLCCSRWFAFFRGIRGRWLGLDLGSRIQGPGFRDVEWLAGGPRSQGRCAQGKRAQGPSNKNGPRKISGQSVFRGATIRVQGPGSGIHGRSIGRPEFAERRIYGSSVTWFRTMTHFPWIFFRTSLQTASIVKAGLPSAGVNVFRSTPTTMMSSPTRV